MNKLYWMLYIHCLISHLLELLKRFSLTKPTFKYQELTNYGHFGRPDLDLPFEKLDMVDKLIEFCHRG